jgi:hypothetical protein
LRCRYQSFSPAIGANRQLHSYSDDARHDRTPVLVAACSKGACSRTPLGHGFASPDWRALRRADGSLSFGRARVDRGPIHWAVLVARRGLGAELARSARASCCCLTGGPPSLAVLPQLQYLSAGMTSPHHRVSSSPLILNRLLYPLPRSEHESPHGTVRLSSPQLPADASCSLCATPTLRG